MKYASIVDRKVSITDVDISFSEQYDVCVAGLGTAGAIAAISAAKNGLSVLGIERLTGMGGIGTFGCVWDYYYGSSGGLYEEINNECKKYYGRGYYDSDRNQNNTSVPGHVKSMVLERSAEKHGCRIYFETFITGVFLEGNKVIGLSVLRNSQTLNIGAKIVIDCTGNSFLCRAAGCETLGGRDWDGRLMRFSKPIGVLTGSYIMGKWGNIDYIDEYHAESYTDAALKIMTAPPCLLDRYERKDRVIFESTTLGIREVKRIRTEEVLTFADFANGKMTDKPVMYTFAPLDNTNKDFAFEDELQQDWRLICEMFCYGFSAAVPFGIFLPKGIDGLLTAGRGMGTDHTMSAHFRMKKDLEKAGEICAIAAKKAIKNGCSLRDIDYGELSGELIESGCLDKSNNIGIGSLDVPDDLKWRSEKLITDIGELKEALSKPQASLALWSARQLEKKGKTEYLKKWLSSDNENLKTNSAFVLGMLGERECIAVLLDIVKKGPVAPPDYARRYRHFHDYYPDFSKAVALLGRFGEPAAVELLLDILHDDAYEISRELPLTACYGNREIYREQFVSLSIASLFKIAKRNKAFKEEIKESISEWCQNISNISDDFENMKQQVSINLREL